MRVGIVSIDEKLILSWLMLDGGRVVGIRPSEFLGVYEVAIEHPEMPEVAEQERIPYIYLAYTDTVDRAGRHTITREPIGR